MDRHHEAVNRDRGHNPTPHIGVGDLEKLLLASCYRYLNSTITCFPVLKSRYDDPCTVV